MKMRYFIWLLYIGGQLFLGTLIYYQTSEELKAFVWLESWCPWLYQLAVNLAELFPKIPSGVWVDNHLADILWASSFASFMVGIWSAQLRFYKSLLLGMGCGIFYESLQLVGVMSGTYDHFDALFSLMAGGISTVITCLLLQRTHGFRAEQ